jgi:hypothetical protein
MKFIRENEQDSRLIVFPYLRPSVIEQGFGFSVT